MEATLPKKEIIQDFFYIKHNRTLIKLDVKNISYIKVDGRYSEIYYADQRYLCRKSLTDLVAMLPQDRFVRTHRNFLLNKYFVKEVIFGESSVYLTNGAVLPVSTRYLDAVRSLFPIVS